MIRLLQLSISVSIEDFFEDYNFPFHSAQKMIQKYLNKKINNAIYRFNQTNLSSVLDMVCTFYVFCLKGSLPFETLFLSVLKIDFIVVELFWF
jgi:hypothetical protein